MQLTKVFLGDRLDFLDWKISTFAIYLKIHRYLMHIKSLLKSSALSINHKILTLMLYLCTIKNLLYQNHFHVLFYLYMLPDFMFLFWDIFFLQKVENYFLIIHTFLKNMWNIYDWYKSCRCDIYSSNVKRKKMLEKIERNKNEKKLRIFLWFAFEMWTLWSRWSHNYFASKIHIQ